MTNLVLAILFFLVSHIGLSLVPVRDAIILKFNEMIFRIIYSIIALVGITWVVMAYGDAPVQMIWTPGPGLQHLPLLIMPIALFLVACSVMGPNPTAIGQNPDADEGEPARGMIRITRHPMMWGVALWGIVHALANGDMASILLFGAMTVLALAGAQAIDVKRSAHPAPGWGVFVQSTSFWPFGAIIQKRNHLALSEIGIKPLIVTAVLYALLIMLHPWLFGVSALPF